MLSFSTLPSLRRLFCHVCGIGILIFAGCVQAQKPDYPHAKRVEQTDNYHGVQVADPYRWMEDLASDELKTWLAAQDSLRADYLSAHKALISKLQHRIAGAVNIASRSIPIMRGEKTFFTDRAAGEAFGRLVVQTQSDSPPQVLLDFEKKNQSNISIFATSFSFDGRYVTYNIREDQSRWHRVRIRRVADGSDFPETITGYYSGRSNIAWQRDGSGFFYARYEVPENPQAPLGATRIFHHKIGTPQQQDELIYDPQDSSGASYTLRTTHDGRYLIISVSEAGGTFNGLEDRIFYRDLRKPNSRIVRLTPEIDASFAFEGNAGDRFWLRTTLDAPNGRLVEVDLANPKIENWQELIAETNEAIQSVSEIGERFVVTYLRDARTVARIFDFKGRFQNELQQVAPSLSGFSDDRESSVTFFSAPKLYDPGVLYKLDVSTGETSLYFRSQLAHDPETFVTRQVFFESKDGTRVPMYILHKKGLKLDGDNPVFMYAYGAWAWSAFPWQRYMLPWMEMGGVYVVVNIRGGGEYGDAWHKAGIRHNKQNGIDDFIAAAEWLVANDYSSAKKLVANGGSASGIVPAVAAIQRPDLFGASVINFPALDMLRYDKFGSANSWIPEFGTADDPDDFKALFAYSPYHNLKEGTCYPPTWIQVGEKDNTTTPMHGYKFAAALQAAQGCADPVLLKISWGAGHTYGLTPEQSRETQAEELAFLVKTLGMKVPEDFLGSDSE